MLEKLEFRIDAELYKIIKIKAAQLSTKYCKRIERLADKDNNGKKTKRLLKLYERYTLCTCLEAHASVNELIMMTIYNNYDCVDKSFKNKLIKNSIGNDKTMIKNLIKFLL